ncbi:hypothetical protein AAFF_G00064100 [Aldrovandia affinis]|uniref:Uncharacterized protein n=1 Tax=Aldrovandia affinis TaxID=143900 RepID=A0AAD7T4X5_9TELE|nr:hypothetical protein AAFF_G00064100 [Aldrovandia affinis]
MAKTHDFIESSRKAERTSCIGIHMPDLSVLSGRKTLTRSRHDLGQPRSESFRGGSAVGRGDTKEVGEPGRVKGATLVRNPL